MARWITVINNEDGIVESKCYPGGTTWYDVFADIMPGKNAGDYIIRVNHFHVPARQLVEDGDRVSITPNKIWVWGGGALPTRPEIEDDLDEETEMKAMQKEPKNNDSSEICHWCKQPTEPLFGTLMICRKCNK
jgi:hypothetical protein